MFFKRYPIYDVTVLEEKTQHRGERSAHQVTKFSWTCKNQTEPTFLFRLFLFREKITFDVDDVTTLKLTI